MREIKFRAWDTWTTIDEDMPTAMVEETHRVMIKLNGIVYNSEYGDDQPTRYKIMQFTGLKDRLGAEVYDGDIITDGHGNNGVVLFNECECQFIINMGDGIDFQLIGDWCEVIGNIYQNPELLEQK